MRISIFIPNNLVLRQINKRKRKVSTFKGIITSLVSIFGSIFNLI